MPWRAVEATLHKMRPENAEMGLRALRSYDFQAAIRPKRKRRRKTAAKAP